MSSDVAELERQAGDAPTEWQQVTLGKIVRIVTDGISATELAALPEVHHYSLPAFDEGAEPEVGPGNTIKSNKSVVPDDCVLFSKLNPRIPRIWRVRGDSPPHSYCSTEFWPLVAQDGGIDLDYLTHYLSSEAFLGHPDITPSSSTNSHQRVDRKAFERFQFVLPPLDEQRRIAEVLRSVDEAIAAANAVAVKARHLLSSLGREIMQSPDEEPIVGSERLRLLDVCRPKQHPIIGKADLTADGYPVYGANGQIGFAQSFTHAYPVIAITCRGATCGTVNWVPAKSYVTGNAMALDHLDRDRMHERFLFHYVSVWGVARSISGSAQPQITRQSLSCIDIIAPDVSHQADIADALDAIEAEANASENALAAARNLKAAVMSGLLSGRVRVPA